MSVLSRQQRDAIRADTMIDAILIDRCCDAFDALLRGDVDQYRTYMHTAIAQMGMEVVTPEDRPTAVDVLKTILQRRLADEWHCTPREANVRLKKMLEG